MANKTVYYPFISKNGSAGAFKTVSAESYSYALYGDEITGSYPYSSSIDSLYFYQNQTRPKIYALKNVLEKNSIFSRHYSYSSSFGDKSKQIINLISIPSIFYGSSIEKGSISLSFYVSGTLVGKLEDYNKRGELIETTGSNTGSVAGVVLYNEGFILLTGSWKLNQSFIEDYIYNPDGSKTVDFPRWVYWGAGLNKTNCSTISSSFDIDFNGTNYVHTLTMFAHAEKGEFNHSNNPTYIKYDNYSEGIYNSGGYFEKDTMNIKNTVKYEYENYTGSLEKQTFITKIGIYDENKNLIAIAKLAKPVKKTQSRDFTFKLKLDI